MITSPLFYKTTTRLFSKISQALQVSPTQPEVENEWVLYSFPHQDTTNLVSLPPGFGNVMSCCPNNPQEPKPEEVEYWLQEIFNSPMTCAQRGRIVNYQETPQVALNRAKVLAMVMRMKELGAQTIHLIAELSPDEQEFHFIDWERDGEHYRIDPSRSAFLEKMGSNYQTEDIFSSMSSKMFCGLA